MSGNLWFNGWASVGRIELYAIAAFVLLILVVRVLGKRTIAKMNPSDFAFTVAVGSVIANWILQTPVSLVDGIAGLATLLFLQHAMEWLSTRSEVTRKLTEGKPTLLLYRGEMLYRNMRRQNVHSHEVINALRQHGIDRIADAGAVTLEVDGTFSVLRRLDRESEVLCDVENNN